MNRFVETLYDAYAQEFSVDKLYFEHKTQHQHLMIFHNAMFGRVMVLDGIVQTTEKDEFIYHEMLTHVPMLAHGDVKRVLIIGGGDGGMLREVTRHASVESITQVEIDMDVIEMSKTHLPNHSQGAFEDPRLKLVINDGFDFIQSSTELFDVIIGDSTDPIGPGEVLFSKEFYAGCQARLRAGGVLVTQNGAAFLQLEEVQTTSKHLRTVFDDSAFYSAAVPTYVGGIMTFAWASDSAGQRQHKLETLRSRFKKSGIKTRYYTPEIHLASFALPRYLVDAIED
jgi:spermidine synthase